MIQGYDAEPQGGNVPTKSWQPDQLAISGAIIPIPRDIPNGDHYRLEVGWYYLPTMQRLMILNLQGQPTDDKVIIEPLSIRE